ncbi:hypothetical protein BDR26DRAFT_852320 [Obelidium mucronatum]|nr:hypothetical protein BDR26DRAFT_852320 [Obelidium mucronatum]
MSTAWHRLILSVCGLLSLAAHMVSAARGEYYLVQTVQMELGRKGWASYEFTKDTIVSRVIVPEVGPLDAVIITKDKNSYFSDEGCYCELETICYLNCKVSAGSTLYYSPDLEVAQIVATFHMTDYKGFQTYASRASDNLFFALAYRNGEFVQVGRDDKAVLSKRGVPNLSSRIDTHSIPPQGSKSAPLSQFEARSAYLNSRAHQMDTKSLVTIEEKTRDAVAASLADEVLALGILRDSSSGAVSTRGVSTTRASGSTGGSGGGSASSPPSGNSGSSASSQKDDTNAGNSLRAQLMQGVAMLSLVVVAVY